jgi:predicted kinase
VASHPAYVVVSGPPASGKSTLAPVLAHEFSLPLLAKDTVKDALMSTLGVTRIEESRQMGRAAVAVLYALATTSPSGAVIESVFYRTVARDELNRLPGPIVEVFCRCDRLTAERRYRERAGSRHGGHFDHQRTSAELWNDENSEPVAGGWPVIEVDTTRLVDVARLTRRVQSAFRPSEPS